MLKVKSLNGQLHFVAHFSMHDLPTLQVLQQRYNGEMGIWSSLQGEWVPLAQLDLSTAADTTVEVMSHAR